MDGDLGLQIENLTRKADAQIVTIAGREYTTTPLHDPRKSEPEPDAVRVQTLQGFADVVNGQEDDAYRETRGLFVHVASPVQVFLLTGVFGEFNQRVELARAEAIVPPLLFGTWMDQEQFVIHMQCCFAPDDGREKVLRLVGTLTDEAVQTLDDDGVTQTATARAGLVKRASVDVPNPVELTPYSSFAEVEQVRRPFVLRLRGGGGGHPPTCALFECDGGRWRLEAIKRVKAWLGGELPEISIYG